MTLKNVEINWNSKTDSVVPRINMVAGENKEISQTNMVAGENKEMSQTNMVVAENKKMTPALIWLLTIGKFSYSFSMVSSFQIYFIFLINKIFSFNITNKHNCVTKVYLDFNNVQFLLMTRYTNTFDMSFHSDILIKINLAHL